MMIKMIPPYIHGNIKSAAEKKIFDRIKNEEFLSDWKCIHSLGLINHSYKAESEIDFILIGPEGLFCLEVKGGRVKREQGVWTFTDRYGNLNEKKESPFNQASTALYSLLSMINEGLDGTAHDCLFGYGVMFPDIEFTITSPEWDSQIVYDVRDRLKPFQNYLERIIGFWKERFNGKKGKLSHAQIDHIVGYLRKDFELIQPLENRLDNIEKQIISLTNQQYLALDRMESNRRIFFRGTAGTGKTLLALEKVRRVAQEGKKALLLCYNKILGGKIYAEVSQMENSNMIYANSLHKYFYHVITKTSQRDKFLRAINCYDGEELFKKVYPYYFIEALNETSECYDCLVVDEGQDLLCTEYFNALDYVLKGGLEKGEWVVFYDSNNQGELYKNYDDHFANILRSFGVAEYCLDVNCRNTKQIAIQTAVISGFNIEKTLISEGEKVQYFLFKNESEQKDTLVLIIENLLNQRIVPGDITVIYPERQYEELISSLKGNFNFEKINYGNAGSLP